MPIYRRRRSVPVWLFVQQFSKFSSFALQGHLSPNTVAALAIDNGHNNNTSNYNKVRKVLCLKNFLRRHAISAYYKPKTVHGALAPLANRCRFPVALQVSVVGTVCHHCAAQVVTFCLSFLWPLAFTQTRRFQRGWRMDEWVIVCRISRKSSSFRQRGCLQTNWQNEHHLHVS